MKKENLKAPCSKSKAFSSSVYHFLILNCAHCLILLFIMNQEARSTKPDSKKKKKMGKEKNKILLTMTCNLVGVWKACDYIYIYIVYSKLTKKTIVESCNNKLHLQRGVIFGTSIVITFKIYKNLGIKIIIHFTYSVKYMIQFFFFFFLFASSSSSFFSWYTYAKV